MYGPPLKIRLYAALIVAFGVGVLNAKLSAVIVNKGKDAFLLAQSERFDHVFLRHGSTFHICIMLLTGSLLWLIFEGILLVLMKFSRSGNNNN